MPNFATWLHDKPAGTDQNLGALQAFALGAVRWPHWSDQLRDYIAVINQANPNNRDALTQTLAEQFAEWRAQQQRNDDSWWGLFSTHFERIAGGSGLFAFGLAVAILLFLGLNNSGFYTSLAKVDQVRGFITFLFVLTTSVIIILVAIAIFWMDDTEAVKARYQNAKDLITIVIGVLGTIMGFYFGLQASGTGTVTIANLTLSAPIASSKDHVTVSGQIIGGKGPYAFTIEFYDATGALKSKLDLIKGTTDTGIIAQQVDLPEVAKPGSLLFTVAGTDSGGAQGRAGGTLFVMPSPPITPAAPPAPARPAPQGAAPKAPETPSAPQPPAAPSEKSPPQAPQSPQ